MQYGFIFYISIYFLFFVFVLNKTSTTRCVWQTFKTVSSWPMLYYKPHKSGISILRHIHTTCVKTLTLQFLFIAKTFQSHLRSSALSNVHVLVLKNLLKKFSLETQQKLILLWFNGMSQWKLWQLATKASYGLTFHLSSGFSVKPANFSFFN